MIAVSAEAKGDGSSSFEFACHNLSGHVVAFRLDDLLSPPNYRVEAFWGERRGPHGTRINEQW